MPALMAPARHTFRGDDRAQVPAARHWLIDQLGGRDHPAAWDVGLISSELITNAQRHTASGRPGGQVIVMLDVTDDIVWVGVIDQGAVTEPRCTAPDGGATSGRGLGLVAAAATSWGTELTEEGRLVWCLVPAR